MKGEKKGIGLRFAVNGMLHFFASGNARIHLAAAVAVIFAGLWLQVEAADWLWLSLAIALVWVTEMLNSAIELLCDTLHPGHHPLIGKLKDIAAGAVLVSVLFALVVAGIIFVPRIMVVVQG